MAGMLGEVSSSEPQHERGGVVPRHKAHMLPGVWGCTVCNRPPKGNFAPLGRGRHETLMYATAASPLIPGLPRAYLPARQRAIMQNGLHWEEKKGGNNFCRVFYGFFFLHF